MERSLRNNKGLLIASSERKMSSEEKNVEYQREFNDTALRAIVAYANADGGRIYVGIDEFGRSYGARNAQEIAERVATLARDRVRPDVTPYLDVRVENRDGHDVVVATVSRGGSRPYWLADVGLVPAGAPIAENGRVVTPSNRKLRAMLEESGDGEYERERSPIQTLTFTQANKIFDEEKVEFGEHNFRELGLFDSEGTYTNLALLLSDQCPSTIRLAFFEGALENQLHDRLELGGSILRQYLDAFDFLNVFNRSNDKLSSANRGDFRDYPAEILREAILNAIVHRDYRVPTRTLARHYHDRVEIVSPGGLPNGLIVGELNLGVCAPRNPRLARIFYLLEYVESCGTGIRKIFQAYAKLQTRPKFEATPNFFKTTLYNAARASREERVKHVEARVVKAPEPKPEIVLAEQEPVVPARTRRTTTIRDALSVASPTLGGASTTVRPPQLLSDRERLTLQMLEARGTITRADVEQELRLTQAAAAAILRRLVNTGRVVLCGAGSNIWYRLP